MVIATPTTAIDGSLSTTIGGRVVSPALPVVDIHGPNATEQAFQATLHAYAQLHIPTESKDGIERRERVLDRMGRVCTQWVQYVCMQKGMGSSSSGIHNHAAAAAASGKLYTSGSYRLGVHEPGADIDTILVAPSVCTRDDFFGRVRKPSMMIQEEDDESSNQPQRYRDPYSLAERIRTHPDVSNFVPVEGAAVPILTFDWEGINIDLLFARVSALHSNSSFSLQDFDIDNDASLSGADSATEKSLNGPRVTNLIAALVSGTPQRYQTFLQVVRCVRKWAKARGLYSNKLGYWGGVNINIGVALVVQLYPNACAAILLRKFFLVFKTWRWPQPVLLTQPHDAGFGFPVWNPAQASSMMRAPMITPAYPAMNSTLSISRQTLQILTEEFERAHTIVDQLWKQFSKKQKQNQQQQQHRSAVVDDENLFEDDEEKDGDMIDWSILFQPSDFFIAFPVYLSICMVGPTQADAQAWSGFVESRLRKLVSDMLGRSLPVKKIQLWPKKFDLCVADTDNTAMLTLAQRQNSTTYFIGLQIDKKRMRGHQLNVEIPLTSFRMELSKFHPMIPGMDIIVKNFTVKELPKVCFDSIYPGGKDEAMKKRRHLRNQDPELQEKRRRLRLEELNAKVTAMEERKKEKDEKEATQERKKRKRQELEPELGTNEEEEDYEVALDGEDQDEIVSNNNNNNKNHKNYIESDEVDVEESDLLESALDTIMQEPLTAGEAKTREEAEADRRKLLAGEMLDESEVAVVGSDDDENDDDYDAYKADRGRHRIIKKKKEHTENVAVEVETSSSTPVIERKHIRSLPVTEKEAELLDKLGYALVSDDEAKMIGANLLPPWRAPGSSIPDPDTWKLPHTTITFLDKFDIVELDALGHVIDRGDEDFTPSKAWTGSKLGFEFKVGERGLGYYRTGKKVVVPSNMAY